MSSLEEFYQNNNDGSYHFNSTFKQLISDGESKCEVKGDTLLVYIPMIKDYAKIHKSQLEKLQDMEEPAFPNFKYLENYGIKFKNYHEIAISVNHKYWYIDGSPDQWRAKPLRFKIGDNLFEISLMSKFMALVTESIYGDEEYGYIDFEHWATMKIVINNKSDHKEEFCKGLYYLNSHYLKDHEFHATLTRLSTTDYHEDHMIDDEDLLKITSKMTRSNMRTREDFTNIEPLNLYNASVSMSGDQKFLCLYRILEFFMYRSLINVLHESRNDKSITDENLYEFLNIRQEVQQLKHLLKDALTASEKKEIANFCNYHKLIDAKDFEKVSGALYSYRNSLVHAKEREIGKTVFPNPFTNVQGNSSWIYVLEIITRRCIKKYNTIKPL